MFILALSKKPLPNLIMFQNLPPHLPHYLFRLLRNRKIGNLIPFQPMHSIYINSRNTSATLHLVFLQRLHRVANDDEIPVSTLLSNWLGVALLRQPTGSIIYSQNLYLFSFFASLDDDDDDDANNFLLLVRGRG